MDPHRANTKSSVELVRVTHVVVIELPNCVNVFACLVPVWCMNKPWI